MIVVTGSTGHVGRLVAEELAEIATAATGRPHRYEPVGEDVWEARWREIGRTGWELEGGFTTYAALRAGEFDVVTDDFRRLTGNDPLTIGEIIARLSLGSSPATS